MTDLDPGVTLLCGTWRPCIPRAPELGELAMTWAASTSGTVVYVALEDPVTTYARLAELAAELEPDPPAAVAIVDYAMPSYRTLPWGDALPWFRNLLEDRPALLVVDSLRCLISGTWTDKYAGVGELHALAVRRGVAVLAVYHDADAPSDELARSVGTVDRVGPTPRTPPGPFEVGPTGFLHVL